MKRISEKWIDYLHEQKEWLKEIQEALYPTLYEYDLKRFTYDVEEGYKSLDTGLQDFKSYTFVFFTNQQGKIIIEIAPDCMPVVTSGKHTYSFAQFYKLESTQVVELEDFFDTFARVLRQN